MECEMENLTSRRNSICQHIKKLGANKSYRDEHGQFLCDGKKLFDEAVNGGAEIEFVLTSESLEHSLPSSTKVYHAQDSLIDSLSPLKNSQGLLFVCRTPQASDHTFHSGTHILLDRVQDPGNVGTIIRSAYAFGVESILLTEGCADIYNLKTMRASMGAVFKQKIYLTCLLELHEFKESGVKVIGASNDSGSKDIKHANLKNAIIILGSEGQGIAESLLELCDEKIRIPIKPDCESLNVATAASIIMWEARGKQ